MTFFEHAMVGVDGALALGLNRRWGWPIVTLAAFESMLPDWDGLTLCAGPQGYDWGHRVWGHNLLVTSLIAVVTAFILWRFEWITRVQQALGQRWNVLAVNDQARSTTERSWRAGLVWIAVGVAAGWLHLLGDVLFSVGRDLPQWGVPLCWPFSRHEYAWSMVPWGDVGATVVLATGMFAMVRWPRRTQTIPAAVLGLLVVYIAARGCLL